jgi:hypothetical protein
VVREALTGAFYLDLDNLVLVVNVDGATDVMWLVDAAEGVASCSDIVDHGLDSPA